AQRQNVVPDKFENPRHEVEPERAVDEKRNRSRLLPDIHVRCVRATSIPMSAPEFPDPTTKTPPSCSCEGFRYSCECNCRIPRSRSRANAGTFGRDRKSV